MASNSKPEILPNSQIPFRSPHISVAGHIVSLCVMQAKTRRCRGLSIATASWPSPPPACSPRPSGTPPHPPANEHLGPLSCTEQAALSATLRRRRATTPTSGGLGPLPPCMRRVGSCRHPSMPGAPPLKPAMRRDRCGIIFGCPAMASQHHITIWHAGGGRSMPE